MKIRYCSDLHTEFFGAYNKVGLIEAVDGELVPYHKDDAKSLLVVAGDTFVSYMIHGSCIAQYALEALSVRFRGVIIITGNHDYYDSTIVAVNDDLRALCDKFNNVHFLDNDTIEIDGVVFFGSCFWTPLSIDSAENYRISRTINDFYKISVDKNKILTVDGFKELHDIALESLKDVVKQCHDKQIVVITHHAPHTLSNGMQAHYNTNYTNFAYCSDQSEFILDNPNIFLWIHGHTHVSCDYTIGDCRIVSNPFGYVLRDENRDYATKFIDINNSDKYI